MESEIMEQKAYSGRVRLPYSPGGAWNDVFNILAISGYKVTATVELPQGMCEFDDVSKSIVIEFEEARADK